MPTMRKHYHTPRGGLILFLILAAGVALADVWPSWLSPAQGSYDRGNQALSGAVERLTVVAGPDAWKSYVTTNIWADYFSQWAKCSAAKEMLGAAVDGYYYTYPTNDISVPENVAFITKSNLLVRIGAPTNWWDVTPRFNLAMDTNGWVLMPAAMSNVVWIADGYSGGIPVMFVETNSIEGYYDIYNVWRTNDFEPFKVGYNVAQVTVASNFYRIASDFYWNLGASLTYLALDEVPFVADVYAKVGPKDVFNQQGDSVSTNWFKIQTWTNDIHGSSPYWCLAANKTNTPPNWSATDKIGWYFDSVYENMSHIVYKYNATTNGFKWFR